MATFFFTIHARLWLLKYGISDFYYAFYLLKKNCQESISILRAPQMTTNEYEISNVSMLNMKNTLKNVGLCK